MGYLFSLASLSKSGAERGLEGSELLLLIFGLVLAAGAAGEYLEDHGRLPHRMKLFFVWMVALSLIGEFIGDAGVYLCSGRLQSINDKETADLNKEAGAARAKAADTALRAGQLEKDNLLLQADILKLRRRTEYRHLTPSQQAFLSTKMKEFQGVNWALVVFAAGEDSSIIANDIESSLDRERGAGWKLVSKSGTNTSAPDIGIVIEITPNASETALRAATALAMALRDDGLFVPTVRAFQRIVGIMGTDAAEIVVTIQKRP